MHLGSTQTFPCLGRASLPPSYRSRQRPRSRLRLFPPTAKLPGRFSCIPPSPPAACISVLKPPAAVPPDSSKPESGLSSGRRRCLPPSSREECLRDRLHPQVSCSPVFLRTCSS